MLNVLRGVFRMPWAEPWLRRRTMGASPASFFGRLIPPEYTYPKGSWRTIEWDGLKLRLDLSNANDHGAFYGLRGTVDEVLLGIVGPGSTVIDIGGNIGIYALTFAKAVRGRGGKVISFEPHPGTFARLLDHALMNPDLPVEVHQLGIGPVAEVVRLYEVDPSNSGMNRIADERAMPKGTPFHEVRIGPLRSALGPVLPKRIDLIKIDVEGFEMAVLKGSEDVIKSTRPLLFIELDDANLRDHCSSAREVVAWVEGLGYRVSDGATGAPIRSADPLGDVQIDILCRPLPENEIQRMPIACAVDASHCRNSK